MSEPTFAELAPNAEGLIEVPDDVKAKAKAEHPAGSLRILVAQRPKLEILVKIPGAGVLDIYRKESVSISDPEKMANAAGGLFWASVLWPDRKTLQRLFADEGTPLAADVLGREVAKEAGENQTIRAKKL